MVVVIVLALGLFAPARGLTLAAPQSSAPQMAFSLIGGGGLPMPCANWNS